MAFSFAAAGAAPAGAPTNLTASSPREVSTPVALYFNPTTRDFRIDDEGRYLSMHPVDQAVALAVFHALGAIPAAADVGSIVRRIQYAGGPRLVAEVTDSIRQAVVDLAKAGDVREERIEVKTGGFGGVSVLYVYTNLRTKKTGQEVTVQISE
ncbi:MAG: hypothetical protein ACTHU0_21310 [Kofleriaceae bacterium]